MRRDTPKLRGLIGRLVRPAHRLQSRWVLCPGCHADFVNPVSWHELSETHWWGVEQIAAAIVRLDRERMIADSDAIMAALERDLIEPGDFFR